MRISLGILAYNESKRILASLKSLEEQALFNGDYDCELVIVPNGCTDDTAAVAREFLRQSRVEAFRRGKVEEVSEAGKSNAWNRFVHDFSDPAADYVFFLDADIAFLQKDALKTLVDTLEANRELWVVTDVPIKDVTLMERRTPLQSLVASVGNKARTDAICGQAYCARATAVRQVTMPIGLPVEDGFLRAMIDTEFFTTTTSRAEVRLRVVEEASHVFEAYQNFAQLLRHEKRLIIGGAINQVLFDDLWIQAKTAKVGELIRRRNEANPSWVRDLVADYAKRHFWMVERSLFTRRWPARRRPLPFGVAVSAGLTLVDALLVLEANRTLRGSTGVGYW